jgi:hypothetical protein
VRSREESWALMAGGMSGQAPSCLQPTLETGRIDGRVHCVASANYAGRRRERVFEFLFLEGSTCRLLVISDHSRLRNIKMYGRTTS